MRVRKTITCHRNGQNVDHPITTFGFFRILNSRFLISQIKKNIQKAKNEIRKEKLKSVEKISRLVRDKRKECGRQIQDDSSPVVGTADMYNIAGANYVAPNAQQSKKNTTKKKDSHR